MRKQALPIVLLIENMIIRIGSVLGHGEKRDYRANVEAG